MAVLAGTLGCDVLTPRPEGSLGEEGVAYFQPEVDGVTSVPLMVGSVFSITAEANSDDDTSRVTAGYFVSTNSNIIEVVEGSTLGGELRVTGPGTTKIEIHSDSGERIDAIEISAQEAATIELLDAKLVGASVDARLPAHFAVVQNYDAPFFVAAESACGEPLLALGGFTATFGDETLAGFESSEDAGDLTHFLRPQAIGATSLVIETASGASLDYEIDVVSEDDIDTVENTAAASESPTVEFWGRSFVSGVEVIGLDYTWSSPNGRVSVSRTSGSNVIASVTFPAEGEPEDTRPAEIQAEVFGVSDVVDIFFLQTADLVGQRVEPKEDTTSPGFDPAGCNGDNSSGTCGAALIGGLWFWRRRRRKANA